MHEFGDEAACTVADARSTAPSNLAWQLRVFNGVHAGARAEVAADAWYLVGAAADCDFILRDPSVARHHFLLFIRDGRGALRAVDGDVETAQRRFAPGHSCGLEAATVLVVGGVAMAVGPEDGADWAQLQAEALALASSSAPVPSLASLSAQAGAATDAQGTDPADESIAAKVAAVDDAAPAGGTRRTWRNWLARLDRRWLAPAAALVVLGALGSAAAVWSSQSRSLERLKQVEQAVAALDLPEVRVEQGAHGDLRVVGTVSTEALRSELVGTLMSQGLRPTFDLVTGEHLALGVENGLRQRGLRAEAVYAGDGEVHLSGIGETPEAVAVVREILSVNGKIRAIKFADVFVASAQPGTQSAGTSGSAAAAGAGSAANLRDPKRIVAVVGGEYAYVLTHDGTRYTQGALLPDGSKLESIDGHDVVFERNGQRVLVQF